MYVYSVTCIMLPALQPTLGVREHAVHVTCTTLSVCSERWSSRCTCCTLWCSALCWERGASDLPADSCLGPQQCSGRSGGAEWWGGCNCSLLHCLTAGAFLHVRISKNVVLLHMRSKANFRVLHILFNYVCAQSVKNVKCCQCSMLSSLCYI